MSPGPCMSVCGKLRGLVSSISRIMHYSFRRSLFSEIFLETLQDLDAVMWIVGSSVPQAHAMQS